MRAFISQRLIPTVDGKRAAAIEILLGTPTVKELILRGDIDGIKEVMRKSENIGMQTFDTALFRLYDAGRISLDEAIKNADSANDLRLRVKLSKEGKEPDAEEEKPSLSLSLEPVTSEEEEQ